MATQDTSNGLPPGRRASVFTTTRPYTSYMSITPHTPDLSYEESAIADDTPTTSRLNSKSKEVAIPGTGPDTARGSMEETPMPRRTASKSFSALRSGALEVSSLVRKMSKSMRQKNHKPRNDLTNATNASNAGLLSMESGAAKAEGSAGRPKGTWFRGQRPYRRPSLPLLHPQLIEMYNNPNIVAPVPGSGPLPPILPHDMNNGAAARAAAAAQNEALMEANRSPYLVKTDRRLSRRLSDLKLTRDSESGIGIDLRDQPESTNYDVEVIRQDPAGMLPTEIMELIFSYLDPTSLMNAELVCSEWNAKARSRHVWRHTFHHEYSRYTAGDFGVAKSVRLPAAGLGKPHRDQDWKRMYRVRRALEQRWEDGQAAAIYLNGHKDSVYCVQFDENKIITGSRDQTIRVWDAKTYQCVKIIGVPVSHNPHQAPAPWAPPLSSNGLIPMCSINTTSRDPSSRKGSLPPADYHKASILCLQFDNEIMVTGSSDATCIVWNIRDNYAPVRRLRGHTAGVLDVCFDHRYIVTCSKDNTICVWDRASGDLLRRLTGHRGPVNAVQLKGDLVVSASGDGVAKLWNLTSGLCIKEFPSRDRGLACVEFSDDGKTILAGGNDQVIYQFDANTGELVRDLKGHKGLVRSLHLDTVNNRIVSGSYDMSIKVWDADKGNDATDGGLKLDFEGWTTSWMLAAKSDYRRVVATSQDGRAVILDFGYGLEGVNLLEG